MGKKRVRHSADLKALEALKGVKTVNELAGQYPLLPTQISQWKYFVALTMGTIIREDSIIDRLVDSDG